MRMRERKQKATRKVIVSGISVFLAILIFAYGCWGIISKQAFDTASVLITISSSLATMIAVGMLVKYNRDAEIEFGYLPYLAVLSFIILLGAGVCVMILDFAFHEYGYIPLSSDLEKIAFVICTDGFIFMILLLLNRHL